MKREVSVTYISLDNDVESSKQFLEQEQIGGAHLFVSVDTWSSVMSAFGNTAIPFQILINKEGRVVAKGNQYRLTSSLTKKIMSQLIEEM